MKRFSWIWYKLLLILITAFTFDCNNVHLDNWIKWSGTSELLTIRSWSSSWMHIHFERRRSTFAKMKLFLAKYRLFYLTTLFICLDLLKGDDNIPVLKAVTLSSTVLLQCPGYSEAGNRWEHEGKNIYLDNANVGKFPQESMYLMQNYSLYIPNVTIYHFGTYRCFRDSLQRTYFLLESGLFHFFNSRYRLSYQNFICK